MKPTNVEKLNNAQGLRLRWILTQLLAFNSQHHVLQDGERMIIHRIYNEICAYVCN